jgi:hypothetical protein
VIILPVWADGEASGRDEDDATCASMRVMTTPAQQFGRACMTMGSQHHDQGNGEPFQCSGQHHCNDSSAGIAQLHFSSKNGHQEECNIAYTLRVPPILMKTNSSNVPAPRDHTLVIVVVTLPS